MRQSRSAKLENQFVGEGHYDLCLRIGELITLQEKLGVGPQNLSERLLKQEWFVEDITETIRLALIGGGMSPQEAFGLVKRNIIEGYLVEYAMIAANVLIAAVHGVDDEPIPNLGEAEAPTNEMMTHEDSSLGDHFSRSAGRQDSHHEM